MHYIVSSLLVFLFVAISGVAQQSVWRMESLLPIPDFAETQKIAKSGNAEAQYTLGHMYLMGTGVTKNEVLGLGWIRSAAEQGDSEAQYAFYQLESENHLKKGSQYNLSSVDEKHRIFAKTQDWLRKAAEQGNAKAQYSIGSDYEYGISVPENISEAVKWWLKAAVQGNQKAQASLSMVYSDGRIPKDLVQAYTWAKIFGANEEYIGSLENQMNSEQKAAAIKLALAWWHKAAEQGDGRAANILGVIYAAGRDVPINDGQAAKWHQIAAQQDYDDSQYCLGVHYAEGKGVPKDLGQAYFWLSVSAEYFNVLAKDKVKIIENQMNGEQKAAAIKLALAWWHKAAEQGNGRAANILGFKYYYGIDVPRDWPQAYVWLSLADILGLRWLFPNGPKELAHLKHRLTFEQIAAAENQKNELLAKIPKNNFRFFHE